MEILLLIIGIITGYLSVGVIVSAAMHAVSRNTADGMSLTTVGLSTLIWPLQLIVGIIALLIGLLAILAKIPAVKWFIEAIGELVVELFHLKLTKDEQHLPFHELPDRFRQGLTITHTPTPHTFNLYTVTSDATGEFRCYGLWDLTVQKFLNAEKSHTKWLALKEEMDKEKAE